MKPQSPLSAPMIEPAAPAGSTSVHLDPVAETLLLPLVYRAMESRRPDGLLRDPQAAAILAQLDLDVSRIERQVFQPTAAMMRTREFDRTVRAFLRAHADAVVVDLGCGLDARFERLVDGRTEAGRTRWYNLDLPGVMALRERFFTPGPRCRHLASSIFDLAWMDAVDAAGAACLFLAEGVFLYNAEAEVRRLVLALLARFPGSRLVFDAAPRWMVQYRDLVLRVLRSRGPIRWGAQVRWGVRDSRDLEQWDPRLRLLRDWRYYHHGARRGRLFSLIGSLPLARDFRVLHYRLG